MNVSRTKTEQTPHAVAVEGGGMVYVSHEDWLDWLYSCAERWEQKGERHQASLIRSKILLAKHRRCAVCLRMQQPRMKI